jgi:hypothetical protein
MCSECQGTMKCKTCGGTGKVPYVQPENEAPGKSKDQVCTACHGMGKCPKCCD